jgi:allantoicase
VELIFPTELLDLASERLGGCVLATNDDFFAEKENLIKAADPIFVAGKYTDRGKWMDGWESRRKRVAGHDWAIVRLGAPGVVKRVVVDTSFFTGNYPEHCSIEGCEAPANTRPDQLNGWGELLPKSALQGNEKNVFEVSLHRRFTHLCLNIFPDGGVARLRVFGTPLPDWKKFGAEIDLAAAECGGMVVDSSDRHYGNPMNLLMPGQALDMSDGWETRRRRGAGHDWTVLRLAAEGIVRRVEVDTSHYKGNYPDSCSLEVSDGGEEGSWCEILPLVKLQAHTRHVFREELATAAPARFARFNIFPDGGVSRLRLYGTLTDASRIEAGLHSLNAAGDETAVRDLLRCCGSSNWAKRMAGIRPFSNIDEFEEAADRVWALCSREDWLEAFAAHPKIGQRSNNEWSRKEQAGTNEPTADIQAALERGNEQYAKKFGYIFIVCATGKTASQILENLQQRLANDSESELYHAAEQQQLITHLRLRKLLSE